METLFTIERLFRFIAEYNKDHADSIYLKFCNDFEGSGEIHYGAQIFNNKGTTLLEHWSDVSFEEAMTGLLQKIAK